MRTPAIAVVVAGRVEGGCRRLRVRASARRLVVGPRMAARVGGSMEAARTFRGDARRARAGAQMGGWGGLKAGSRVHGPGVRCPVFGARCSVPGGPRCCRPLMPAVLSSPPRLAGGDPRFATASRAGCGASRRSERRRRPSERAQLPRVRAAEQPKRGGQSTTGGPPGAEPRPVMLGWIERRVGGPNPASGTLAGPSARPAPDARHGRARLRQRRVTFAGPQLPSTSTGRTRTATFAARLRTGRTIPAVGVCSVAIFHGPLLTEYWTR